MKDVLVASDAVPDKRNTEDAPTDEEPYLEKYDDPRNGVSLGLPVLEQVLLAFIRLYPHKDSERKRLDNAMLALTGRESCRAPLPRSADLRNPEERDEEMLMWMEARLGDGYCLKTGKFQQPGDSVSSRRLAIDAVDHFYSTSNEDFKIYKVDQLRRIFNNDKRYTAKNSYVGAASSSRYRAHHHDYILDSIERTRAAKICDLFVYFYEGLKMDWRTENE